MRKKERLLEIELGLEGVLEKVAQFSENTLSKVQKILKETENSLEERIARLEKKQGRSGASNGEIQSFFQAVMRLQEEQEAMRLEINQLKDSQVNLGGVGHQKTINEAKIISEERTINENTGKEEKELPRNYHRLPPSDRSKVQESERVLEKFKREKPQWDMTPWGEELPPKPKANEEKIERISRKANQEEARHLTDANGSSRNNQRSIERRKNMEGFRVSVQNELRKGEELLAKSQQKQNQNEEPVSYKEARSSPRSQLHGETSSTKGGGVYTPTNQVSKGYYGAEEGKEPTDTLTYTRSSAFSHKYSSFNSKCSGSGLGNRTYNGEEPSGIARDWEERMKSKDSKWASTGLPPKNEANNSQLKGEAHYSGANNSPSITREKGQEHPGNKKEKGSLMEREKEIPERNWLIGSDEGPRRKSGTRVAGVYEENEPRAGTIIREGRSGGILKENEAIRKNEISLLEQKMKERREFLNNAIGKRQNKFS